MFKVSDESVNSYGLRVLSSGGDFSEFEKNPIMLYDHNDYKYLPIGTWSDLKLGDGGVITAEESFDTDDEFAMSIKGKVDKGIIKMASIGLIPLEWSDDPALMHPGQTNVTITKWKLREISITPFGSNKNAFKLYDQSGKEINLSDNKLFFNTKSENKMSDNKSTLMTMLVAGLGLSDTANESELVRVILSNNTELITLRKENRLLKEKQEQDTKTVELRDKEALIATAVADKRITLKQKDVYLKLELNDLKVVLEGLPKPNIELDAVLMAAPERESWTFSDWSKKNSDGLAAMKLNDKEKYNALFKAEYNVEPKN